MYSTPLFQLIILDERSNSYSRHCMSAQKSEIVENNSMKTTFCTEGPIEIINIICVCLILRLYEINVFLS